MSNNTSQRKLHGTSTMSISQYELPQIDSTIAEQISNSPALMRPSEYLAFLEQQKQIELLERINNHLISASIQTQDHLKKAEEAGASIVQHSGLWTDLAKHIYQLEQCLWLLCDASGLNRNSLLRELSSNKDHLASEIDIRISEGRVLIKMPHLSVEKPRRVSLPEDLLLSKLSSKKKLPHFSKCHATFCHIYPTSIKHLPRDVANYDYRRVIDILSYAFGFSDCAATFSLQLGALFTDDIPYGTYIALNETPPPMSSIFECFREPQNNKMRRKNSQ